MNELLKYFKGTGRLARAIVAAFALTMLALPTPVAAEIYGYAEARYLRIEGAGPSLPEYVTSQRFRPTFSDELDSIPEINFTATPEFRLIQYEDLPPAIEETDDYLTVERLYMDADVGPARVRVGRQAINWGSAMVWNPTDLFQEVFLTDYWAERQGVNAARVYLPLPQDFRLTMAAATGESKFYENRYAAKASLRRWEADLSVVWSDDVVADRLVWGLDLKGTAVVGYWIEAATFAPKNERDDPFNQAVLGIDYSFPVRSTLYVAGQYYYDGSGEADPDDYDWIGLALGRRQTLGMHYANLLATLAWNSEISMAVNAIYNLDDSTMMASPYLTVSYENLRVSAGANLLAGPEGGEFRPHSSQDPMKIVAERAYYVWARYYL